MISLTTLQIQSTTGASQTICRCWRMVRADGKALLFTDHDELLTIGTDVYNPSDSIQSSAAAKSAGVAVRDKEIVGVISDDLITEEDLQAGLYRDAVINEFLYDWMNPNAGAMLNETYWIADTKWNGLSWTADIQSATSWLASPVGGTTSRDCSHNLGDSICRVDVTPYLKTGTVTSIVTPNTVFGTGLSGEAYAGIYNDGRLKFTSGLNSGYAYPVKSYAATDGKITLWLEPVYRLVDGDTFVLRPACDRTITMCKGAYNNVNNFGGFIYLLGRDRLQKTIDYSRQ